MFIIIYRNVRVSSQSFTSYTDENRKMKVGTVASRAVADCSWVTMGVIVQVGVQVLTI